MHTIIMNRLRPQAITAVLLALLVLAGSTLLHAQEQTSVFEVRGADDNVLYLAGTIHLLRQSDYPLPPQFEQAYEASDRLYFETDINALNDVSLQSTIMQQLTYQDGRTVRDVLNDEAYAALEEYVSEAGMPMAMLQNFKPGLLYSTLSVVEFRKLGFTPQGVDMYFNTRAMGDSKATAELESIQDQIDMLAAMGEGNESDFILYALEDFEQAGEQVEIMVEQWRSGDMQAMQELFVADMKAEAPESYETMLVERNHNWIPVIEEALRDEGTAMVLVGVAHLPGEDGLLGLLEDRGYSISPL
ncbi:MAG: TraB/GumN family protein [Pseudohongiellaceae bacterium]